MRSHYLFCYIFPHFQSDTFKVNVRNIREYYVKYCQSHITLLWIWMMLCNGDSSEKGTMSSSKWWGPRMWNQNGPPCLTLVNPISKTHLNIFQPFDSWTTPFIDFEQWLVSFKVDLVDSGAREPLICWSGWYIYHWGTMADLAFNCVPVKLVVKTPKNKNKNKTL